MGYYSQVGYVIQGRKEEIVPILMAYRLTYPKPAFAKQALDECTFNLTDNTLTIKFSSDNTKWYKGYEDVENHNALFEAFREAAETKDSEINGCFARIGEEDDDIKTNSYGSDPYDLVRAVRTIEFDVEATNTLEEVLK
jgi:hypothetical protein